VDESKEEIKRINFILLGQRLRLVSNTTGQRRMKKSTNMAEFENALEGFYYAARVEIVS
jgi:hypothetical protein